MSGSEGDRGDGSESASDRPHEPDEPAVPGEDNPGERLIAKYDPTIDDGRPEDEVAPDTEDVDVPQETARLFWYLVAVFNVALMGVAVGFMLIVFQGRLTLGGQLAAAGAVFLAYGCYRYRKHVGGDGSVADGAGDAGADDDAVEDGTDDADDVTEDAGEGVNDDGDVHGEAGEDVHDEAGDDNG